MLNEKIQKALNDQIELEFNAAYLYLAMGAHFESQNLPGFAHWMKLQYKEETNHGLKLFDYIADRGGKITLGPIAKPTASFGTAAEVFKQVLEHERKVTASIHQLCDLAVGEKDYATQSMLLWFVNEQVEEEKTAEQVLHQVEAIENRAHLLLMVDHHLGKRAG